ncbi:Hypothetical protein, putative [Bodo saltans]|uniref:Uncharacterized protein n=1 Tax=Bodo saltans TaxID=75058 RepID=A0A0S4JV49_BODSA|nr:Hypothetical protein, putative [Bodo saltans]|eukprot:CUG94106.1 Hypothetical protein, putative [Bodo saltans]
MSVELQKIVVEFPSSLGSVLATGGAELIEEIREPTTTTPATSGVSSSGSLPPPASPTPTVHKRSLLALDEEERRERLKAASSSSVVIGMDTEYLDVLQRARTRLLGDKQLKDGFLFTTDASLWANAAQIVEAVRLRSLCLQLENRDTTASELEEAVAIHNAECTLPGRYEMTQTPVAAETEISLLSTSAIADDHSVARMQVDVSHSNDLSALFKVSAAPVKLWSVSEVVALRVPASTDVKLQQMLMAHCCTSASTLADITKAHRRVATPAEMERPIGGVGGSLFSPRGFATRFAMSPETLVHHVLGSGSQAQQQPNRVRLRSGLFLSLVSVNTFVIVTRHLRGAKQLEYSSLVDESFSSGLLAQVEDAVGSSPFRMEWGDAIEKQSVAVLKGAKRTGEQLASLVASSLLPATSWPPKIDSLLNCAPDVDVHFVAFPSKGNTYAVTFGPRAEETVPHDELALKQLKQDFAAMQEQSDLLQAKLNAVKRAREEDRSGKQNHTDDISVRRASALDDPERILSDLRATIKSILIKCPASFDDLMRCQDLRDFTPHGGRPVKDLQASLRSVLRDFAVFDKKKYFWKTME